MKASVSPIFCGCEVSAALALSKVAASGPWPRHAVVQRRAAGHEAARPWRRRRRATRPMNSLATLRWNHGGRNVSSPTSQRGGKITKSRFAVPGVSEARCSTVKIDGSGWSKLIEPIVLKRAQVVLVRRVVAVPGDHVQRRVADARRPQGALELGQQLEVAFAILERRHRGEEIARIGQAVGADRARAPAGAAARRSSRTRSRARRRRAARRGSACRAESPRSPAARPRARRVRWRAAGDPAAARSAARRRRCRRTRPSIERLAA